MAGIYIHVPFCKQSCLYCNFHFSTSLNLKNEFVKALLREIELQKNYLEGEEIETIYLGGGTPSLLSLAELDSILSKLRDHFKISRDAEMTLEANPDDITSEKASGWRLAGINRLSIGVQSFFGNDLLWMNRAHTADQSLKSLMQIKEAGFNNLSVDLIYGSPQLTDQNWMENLRIAGEMGIPHLSCYALTVEPQTALHHLIVKNQMQDVNSEDQARQFLMLQEWSAKEGYDHYEISNFAKPGLRSRHNTSYWQQKKYLGLGPSAHSFNGFSRQWNISNNPKYIQSIANEELPFEIETLTPVQKLNEYIMVSLRTAEGIDLNYIKKEFGEEFAIKLVANSGRYLSNGLVEQNDNKIRLTNQGKFLADGIAAELFLI